MSRFISFIRIILTYILVLLAISQHWIAALFLFSTFVGLLFKEKYSLVVWYQLDELAGAVVHAKQGRTVSGIVGEHAQNKKRGYVLLERLINAIFKDDEHCINQFIEEMQIIEFRKTQ